MKPRNTSGIPGEEKKPQRAVLGICPRVSLRYAKHNMVRRTEIGEPKKDKMSAMEFF